MQNVLKILMIDKFGEGKIKEVKVLPPFGAAVSWRYTPSPVVTHILMYPREDDFGEIKYKNPKLNFEGLDAIVILE